MMTHKGYIATVVFDNDADIFHGEVINTTDVITFQGSSVKELRKAFRGSIEDYCAFCAERGEEPQKPLSGKLLLRIPPTLHAQLAAKAASQHTSLNSFIVEQLQSS
jgi:predicted HicB family RNase H-like nuclease